VFWKPSLHNIKTWMDWLKRKGLSTENIHMNNLRGTTKVEEWKRNIWRGTFEGEHLKRKIWRGTFEEEQLKRNSWKATAEVWINVTETAEKRNLKTEGWRETEVIVNCTIGCPSMFKLINWCWPQDFLV
jgi:hypothetical protein